MKREKEKIDLLLEQNESEQLAGFDWNQLQTSISKKLDDAACTKTSIIKYRRIFKVASGIVATAAVVFIAVMIKTNIPTKVKFENGEKGIVAFIENKGSAKVEILDSNGQNSEVRGQSTWIIIRTSEPKVADNGQSRDEADFACLM
jgi:hypothetical protein